MKIVTVLGARPQFIKAAPVSRVLREKHHELIIHTGQHYDANMSDVFFTEMHIPQPEYNLGVGSNSHARMTAAIMVGVEDILLKEKPDCVLLYGDTNSTLAGALAASKLNIPIAHVEAGLRTYINTEPGHRVVYRSEPEEQNRIITDHLARWLFCPSQSAVQSLKEEGIEFGVYFVGDVMYDALLYYSKIAEQDNNEYYFNRLEFLYKRKPNVDSWYIATIHRPDNTDYDRNLINILKALNRLDKKVIFPVHPRTKVVLKRINKENIYDNIYFVSPVSYIDMVYLTKNAKKVITDSGGVHKEAYLMGVPCVTILENTCWVETLNGNWNVLASPDENDIVSKVFDTIIDYSFKANCYGDGDAAKGISDILSK